MQLISPSTLLSLGFFVLAAVSTPLQSTSNNIAKGSPKINCKGSAFCWYKHHKDYLHLPKLVELLKGIDPNRHYQNGEHIACLQQSTAWMNIIFTPGNECVFLQGTEYGLNGSAIGPLVDALVDFGCKDCGSVPIDYPNENAANPGILTVNFVADNWCGTALCVDKYETTLYTR